MCKCIKPVNTQINLFVLTDLVKKINFVADLKLVGKTINRNLERIADFGCCTSQKG